ncbi:MAG TPA: sulfotransferase family 2 domain-containing protein, partial [Stellaceae bacterium]|nr:sulfotransferase family 2 domain-containing protein [Stellaceae bacterium]
MISHDLRCIFTHVPKTAGKSIRYLFGLPEFAEQGIPDGNNIEDGFGHTRLSSLIDSAFFDDYFKFAFVRNPYDRIVSAFCYLIDGGCNNVDRIFREQYLKPYCNDFDAFIEDL